MKNQVSAFRLSQNNILDLDAVNFRELTGLFGLCKYLQENKNKTHEYSDYLKNQTVLSVFLENSTRTRLSFEASAKKLGANVISFQKDGSALAKGESISDTLHNLMAVTEPDFVVFRHKSSEPFFNMALHYEASFINGGAGSKNHPTQGLIDVFAIFNYLKRDFSDGLEGITITILGDVAHSRVCRSSAKLLKRVGAEVILSCPSSSLKGVLEYAEFRHEVNPETALKISDGVLVLRPQQERMGAQKEDKLMSLKPYFLDSDLFNMTGENGFLMHPGPVTRGLEIKSDLVDHPRSLILKQAQLGLYIRMALLVGLRKYDRTSKH